MSGEDREYLLMRAHFHRGMARDAACPEARCVHRQFMKAYQRLLAGIRTARADDGLRPREAAAC